jgi:lysozyme family protein
MASFDPAIALVFANEGGFNKNLGDGEGMTYRGLTVKSDPDYSGWSFINNYIANNGYPAEEYVFPELEQQTKDYYQNKYWVLAQGDNINNQDMANFVFSFFVNSGRAAQEVNIAINKAEGGKVVSETNKLTSDGVNYLNSDNDTIYPVLYQTREDYLHSLASYGRYGKSWERMMAMFPSVLPVQVQRFVASKDGFYLIAGGGLLLGSSIFILLYLRNKKNK